MAFAETFKALSDPVRREILQLLKNGKMSAGEIGGHFDVVIEFFQLADAHSGAADGGDDAPHGVGKAGEGFGMVLLGHIAHALVFDPGFVPEIGVNDLVRVRGVKFGLARHGQHVHDRVKIVDEQNAAGL